MGKRNGGAPEHNAEQFHQQIRAIIDQMQLEGERAYNPLFECLFWKYHRPLCDYAYHLVGSYETASEIVQDTWLQFFSCYFLRQQQPLCWLEQANIPTLLWTITRNNAFDVHRSRKDTISLDSEQITPAFEPYVPPYDLPEAQAIRSDVYFALYDAVKALPKEYRDVIACYYFYGYSESKIARGLGMRLNTVKSYMRRGRARLQDLLEKRGVTVQDLDVLERADESFPKYVSQEEAHINFP